MIRLCHQTIHWNLGRNYYKTSISEKIKAIDNKIEQSKDQYDLDTQTARISALSSGNVSKHEFLIANDVLPEKELLEKAAEIKRFEYFSLSNELKKQSSVAEYQKLWQCFWV